MENDINAQAVFITYACTAPHNNKHELEKVNPHAKRTACRINIRKLSQYITENNCEVVDITKEEAEFFMN